MQSNTLKYFLRVFMIIMASTGLLLTLVPSFLHWQGVIGPVRVDNLMLAGTILWFVSVIFLSSSKGS